MKWRSYTIANQFYCCIKNCLYISPSPKHKCCWQRLEMIKIHYGTYVTKKNAMYLTNKRSFESKVLTEKVAQSTKFFSLWSHWQVFIQIEIRVEGCRNFKNCIEDSTKGRVQIKSSLKFIYSKFCEISTKDLSYVVTIKSMVEILQNFVAFSEYMNFKGQ